MMLQHRRSVRLALKTTWSRLQALLEMRSLCLMVHDTLPSTHCHFEYRIFPLWLEILKLESPACKTFSLQGLALQQPVSCNCSTVCSLGTTVINSLNTSMNFDWSNTVHFIYMQVKAEIQLSVENQNATTPYCKVYCLYCLEGLLIAL